MLPNLYLFDNIREERKRICALIENEENQN